MDELSTTWAQEALSPLQLRLLTDAGAVLTRHRLLLAGGHAMRAHGFTSRRCRGLDFATDAETPLPWVAQDVAEAYRALGFDVAVRDSGERISVLTVTDPGTGAECEIDLLREALQSPPAPGTPCPAVGLDDAVGLKVRALHNRGAARDLVDLAPVRDLYPFRELERLGALHEDDFHLTELVQRLEATDMLSDDAFTRYGLSEEEVDHLRHFAHAWTEDIKLRRVEDDDLPEPNFDIEAPD
ncbi:hypothetical protein [Sinosporangium siamense]|uniref:hypothetical protein n=1 Tax=Sinosporangium siamense TaxID=1367973 RepID=UPI001EF3C9BF|nr:hypothetical protein [Sinosporangium siamense]